MSAWGMDTELTGPVSIEAIAEFPKSGVWDVHGDFMAKAEYANGITTPLESERFYPEIHSLEELVQNSPAKIYRFGKNA